MKVQGRITAKVRTILQNEAEEAMLPVCSVKPVSTSKHRVIVKDFKKPIL